MKLTGNWTGSRKEIRRHIQFSLLLTGILLSIFFCLPVDAKETQDDRNTVLFLLDTSSSMKENDPERLAIDSIAQFVYTLPTNYRTGFVAYNSDIAAECAPLESGQRSRIMELAEQAAYTGYSNAGAGLSLATEYLKSEGGGGKHIVLLSDGEILMEDDAGTNESRRMYAEAVEKAEKAGIRIHVVGLGGGMEDMDNSIFEAAERTGGGTYYTPQAFGIQSAIDTILNEELQIRQSTLAIVDADGETENISADLPYAHADKVRILLTSTAPIQNLSTNFQAESANQVNGGRYSLIELKDPYGTKLSIRFTGTAGSQVRINVVPEYRVIPKAEVFYTDVVPEDEDATAYHRTAEVVYTFYDLDNQDIQLWTEQTFEHRKFKVTVNGEQEEASLRAGQLTLTRTVEKTGGLKARMDYSGLPVNVTGVSHVETELAGPASLPEEEEPPYVLMFAGAGLLLALLAIVLFLIWHRIGNKNVPEPREERPEPGRYSYAGKLNIYITRTPDGCDIPPLSYNLFRLTEGRVISLGEVLERCGVAERFAGAETIYFKPGADRCVILTNNSDGTVMKNREILMKKKSYLLVPEEKVDITFEDETSELMLQYKELMPSERQGT